MLTQMLTTINTEEQKETLSTLIQTIWERFHSKYELEMIWQIITRIRAHYMIVVEKRERLLMADMEESDDEEEYEDEEEETA